VAVAQDNGLDHGAAKCRGTTSFKARVRVRGFIDCYIGRSTFTPDLVRAEMSQALFPKQ